MNDAFGTNGKVLNPESPLGGAMIANRFGFTRNFLRERNTRLYCRLKKIACGFKDRARACLLMDFPGSTQEVYDEAEQCDWRRHHVCCASAERLCDDGDRSWRGRRANPLAYRPDAVGGP